jgi:hypothetical protein
MKMATFDNDLLELLKSELAFIEKGGYGRSVKTPWLPSSIFQDSTICLNYADPKRARPCDDCVLMPFVPESNLLDCIPCHHIPLDDSGQTVESLERSGDQNQLEEAVKGWLRYRIAQLEKRPENRRID